MLFDTVIKIQILDPADESILDGLKKLCEKYDTMFSTTNTDSELYKLNHANGQPFTVSSETANLIQEGIHYSELSGGAFDLTIEPVSALWDFKADKPTVPSSDAIAQAVSHVDYTRSTFRITPLHWKIPKPASIWEPSPKDTLPTR